MLLADARFEDYNNDHLVLKKEIRNAILQEARPIFEQIVKEEQENRLESFLKDRRIFAI
ncbi:unnamed protein product [Penicillium roqueforti FM164]|uniref:Uncharacterized protein n=1 Tax=Penicillium roqueforti (strain FM164) TaxID=1365484 RepID=W6QRZ3_PENRF|nr:unnamed protein product [Penicillium roqueforti FM164]